MEKSAYFVSKFGAPGLNFCCRSENSKVRKRQGGKQEHSKNQ